MTSILIYTITDDNIDWFMDRTHMNSLDNIIYDSIELPADPNPLFGINNVILVNGHRVFNVHPFVLISKSKFIKTKYDPKYKVWIEQIPYKPINIYKMVTSNRDRLTKIEMMTSQLSNDNERIKEYSLRFISADQFNDEMNRIIEKIDSIDKESDTYSYKLIMIFMICIYIIATIRFIVR